MRILWIVNMMFPKLASHLGLKTSTSGTWLIDLAEGLSNLDNVEIGIMTYGQQKDFVDVKIENIRYFVFPGGGKRLLFGNKNTRKDCQKILEQFKPDLIHIHGTEYAPGYEIIKTGTKVPVLLTIQGMLGRIKDEYYGGLSFRELLKCTTLKELLRFKTPFTSKMIFNNSAKRERKVLNSVKYVTGRTDWDKVTMLNINSNLKYYRLNYNLPAPFYNAKKWDINEVQRRSIYLSSSHYSLKGLHVFVDALEIVKSKYPDVKVYMPGGRAKDGKIRASSGYMKFVLKKIKEKGLEENFYFIGGIPSNKVVEELQRANVCVVCSAMEGASATIREASMIGTPSICSYRGGMTELITDGVTGFTYDYPEYSMLALKIMQIFEDDELAISFSEKSIEISEKRHDREKNVLETFKVYEDICANN
ncbi:MAG: glycosyltransferase [Clostridia bacterium]|nr:glycosyltransferase [Clostridia bacterium]